MDEFVVIHHRFLEHPIWAQCDAACLKVFLAALLLAGDKERDVIWNGSRVRVPAGSFIASQESLGLRCGLSRQTLRTSLATIISTGELTSESTNQYTLYTVVNYGNYEPLRLLANQPSPSNLTNDLTSQPTNQPANQPTGSGDPKEEKTKVLNEWFETFWSGYWNKIGKQAARKAWPGALLNVHKERKLKGADARDFLIAKLAEQKEFVDDGTAPIGLDRLHCSTWLNGQRWNDEIKPARSKQESLWDKV